jgi:hypothetical protein
MKVQYFISREIYFKKVLFPRNEINNNIDSEKDIDINSKIKRSRKDDYVNVCKERVLKRIEDEDENEYLTTGGKTW